MRQALLDGADPDCDINDYKYPTLLVHEVVEQRCDVGVAVDFEVMDLLVDAGADIHVETPHAVGNGAFGFAVVQGFYKAAHHLIARGADVNRYSVFWEFVADGDCFNDREVDLARAMVMSGGDYDGLVEEMKTQRDNEVRDYYLSDREDRFDDGAMTMIELMEQWIAERKAMRLEEAWQQVAPAPARLRF